jgi:hypothetical protein
MKVLCGAHCNCGTVAVPDNRQAYTIDILSDFNLPAWSPLVACDD